MSRLDLTKAARPPGHTGRVAAKLSRGGWTMTETGDLTELYQDAYLALRERHGHPGEPERSTTSGSTASDSP